MNLRFERGALAALLTVVVATAPIGCRSGPKGTDDAENRYYSFERTTDGKLPESFLMGVNGSWIPGTWRIVTVAGAPNGKCVMEQSKRTEQVERRPIAWLRQGNYGDLSAQVTLQLLDDEQVSSVPHGAGLAWHVRDANNYLACWVDTSDGKAHAGAMVNGAWRPLGHADVASGVAARWLTVQVEQVGARFRCGVGGRILLEGNAPESLLAGSVGVTTIAAGCAQFDELTVVGAHSN